MKWPVFLFAAIILASCEKESSDSVQWNIVKVEGTDNGNIDEHINLTVFWPTTSGCDKLDGFHQTRQDNTVLIKAFGHTENTGCTLEAVIKTKILNLSLSSKGIYEIRFINRDNSYITHTLVIN